MTLIQKEWLTIHRLIIETQNPICYSGGQLLPIDRQAYFVLIASQFPK